MNVKLEGSESLEKEGKKDSWQISENFQRNMRKEDKIDRKS